MKVSLDLPDGITVVAPLPELLSQRNVEAVLGLPVARFKELLGEAGCPEAIKVGHLRLVDRVAFVGWLRVRSARLAALANDADGAPKPEPDPAHEHLKSWGYQG